MILDKPFWNYILEKQAILDEAFMKDPVFFPNDRYRNFAGLVEVDEFVKEFVESYKWWSRKPNDYDAIAIEFVDILHFMAGLAIAERAEHFYYNGIWTAYAKRVDRYSFKPVFDILEELRAVKKLEEGVGIAIILMERIGFDTESLKVAYDEKNAENFKRIAEGY